MRVLEKKDEVRNLVARARVGGRKIGLVPTMGFFHEGHLELMRLCRSRCGLCLVSIFVNPTQFGPAEDFDRYPRDLERDRALAEAESVDLIFAPAVEEMYAPDSSTVVLENLVSRGLCGLGRPGHFQGVATVVAKLFNIVQPDMAFFGRKDLQQLAVIRRMVRDLDFPVRVEAAPIVREPDGLALSSRNVYLEPEQRARAPGLYRALYRGAGMFSGAKGDTSPLLNEIHREIESATGGRLEYLSAVDEEMEEVDDASDCRYLAAALHLGPVRLIDNVEVA
ncbi:MAG: pantoate--beta-alanine ligase [Candidatus Glassbacteria bacterium]|nr:pantoate--beta-alanine ligase [Candidatus Glassbacteria bacterium]